MSEWTPEATEYFEGYLKQIRALAKHSNEDGEEIASGLRDHIIEKTAREAGPLVTLEVLRRCLAEVGTPESIVNVGKMEAGSIAGVKTSAEPARSPIAPVRSPQRKTGRPLLLGCAVFILLVVLAPVGLAALLRVVRWAPVNPDGQSDQEKTQRASEQKKEAILALQAIARSQSNVLDRKRFDYDKDGSPDYADLPDLDAETGDASTFGKHQVDGYVFHIELTPSSQSGGPSFVAKAIPTSTSSSKEIIAIGPDGVLRFMKADELETKQTEQLEQPNKVETEPGKPPAQ